MFCQTIGIVISQVFFLNTRFLKPRDLQKGINVVGLRALFENYSI